MAGLHDISFIKCIAARHIGSNTSLFDYSRAQTRHERPQGRDLSKYHEYYTSTEHLPKRQMLRNCINKRVYGLVMYKVIISFLWLLSSLKEGTGKRKD